MPKRSAGVGALVASLFALVISLVKLIVIAAAAIVATSWQLVAAIVNAASGKARRTVAAGGGGTPNRPPPSTSPGGRDTKKPRRPPPPSLAAYTAAGVDPGVCTLCGKPVPGRPREWKFCGMDGKPCVICPGCWNKRYVYADHGEATKFMDRMTTFYSNDKPT
jgi:hypothetical protein